MEGQERRYAFLLDDREWRARARESRLDLTFEPWILGRASASKTRDVLSTSAPAASLQLAFDINLSTGWPTVAACCSVTVREEGGRSLVNQEMETSARRPRYIRAAARVYHSRGRIADIFLGDRLTWWRRRRRQAAAKKFPCPSVKRPMRVTRRRLVILGDIRGDLLAQRDQLLPRNLDFEARRDMRGDAFKARISRGVVRARCSLFIVRHSGRKTICVYKRRENITSLSICISDNFCFNGIIFIFLNIIRRIISHIKFLIIV